jgi:hypothetical protein
MDCSAHSGGGGDGGIFRLSRSSNIMKSIVFWDVVPCNLICYRRFGVTIPPSSVRNSNPSKHPAGNKQQAELLTGCLAYSSTLMTETIRSSEMTVNFCWTTVHGTTSQTMVQFAVTLVRTSIPASYSMSMWHVVSF